MVKGEKGYSFWVLFLILIVGFLVYFGTGVRFNEDFVSKIIMALLTMGALFYAYTRGTEEFYLAGIVGVSMYVALVNSFGTLYNGDSPLTLDIILGPWSIFIISLIVTLLCLLWYEKSNSNDKFPLILLVLFVVVWIILSVNVKYFDDWKLENYLTVPFVVLLFIWFKWFRLSNISYGLIFAYMVLHIVGTHYTYSEVPFGFWLSDLLNLGRNHYDRIVHFSFGLLLAYPLREVFIRIGKSRGFWGLYIPVEFVLAFSCIYELIEWGIVILFGGDLGVAYLGTQGDIWDAQKDMALAGLGSLVAMFLVALVHISYRGMDFWKEFGESFKVKSGMLGERVLAKWDRMNKK